MRHSLGLMKMKTSLQSDGLAIEFSEDELRGLVQPYGPSPDRVLAKARRSVPGSFAAAPSTSV
jgi:hypothetical protein